MKTTIGVFFGGSSVEHEVAVISGVQAIANINKQKYNVVPIYMAKDGAMFTGDCLFNIETFKDIDAVRKKTATGFALQPTAESALCAF